MRRLPALLFVFLCGCAAAPESAERSTSAVFAKDIGVVRGAAMSSLMRMGLGVASADTSGSAQSLEAAAGATQVRVALATLTPQSTRMSVWVRGPQPGDALARFVDGVEGVLGPDAPGWQPPR